MKSLPYNEFKIEIETAADVFADYTKYTPFPLKFNNLLDEQLDEACISLMRCPRANFPPLAKCKITITNKNPDQLSDITTKTITMFVSSDKADETPIGSGKYNHEIYLIEETKWLERFIVPATSFVNPVKKEYPTIATNAPFYEISGKYWYGDRFRQGVYSNDDYTGVIISLSTDPVPTMYSISWWGQLLSGGKIYPLIANQDYVEDKASYDYILSPYPATSDFQDINMLKPEVLFRFFLANKADWDKGWQNIIPLISGWWEESKDYSYTVTLTSSTDDVTIQESLGSGEWNTLTANKDGIYVVADNITKIRVLGATTITITYSARYKSKQAKGDTYGYSGFSTSCKVYIYDENEDTMPPNWNALSVINRLLLRAEMTKDGDSPRFSVDPTIAAKLEKIETPELNISECTLREALKVVGSYIHAEPRLNGTLITFDELGGNNETDFDFTTLPCTKQDLQNSIEQFSSSISSTVDNLISSIDYNLGAVIEPYNNMFKTVRTENTFARIQDDNMIIETDYPIQKVLSLTCAVPVETVNGNPRYQILDITKYVMEQGDYMRLSSYDDGLGLSKNYALYYDLNEKNIRGLNFKNLSPYDSSLVEYAIIKIIRLEMAAVKCKNKETGLYEAGYTASEINSYVAYLKNKYPLLMFNISYASVTGAKIRQHKTYTGFSYRPTETLYNQTANLIESQYYGEHLKGVIARLGNVSKTYTFVQRKLKTPQIGDLYRENGKDYYITAVASEINPSNIKHTVALSEDFNRYSDYIAANRERRLFNISDKQAYDSYINYRDFIVIHTSKSDNIPTVADKDKPFMLKCAQGTLETLLYNDDLVCTSCAVVETYDKDKKEIGAAILPLRRLPLGNSIIFTFKFLDNYAAGSTVTYIDGQSDVGGYFQNQVPYKDYYGNVEYMNVAFEFSYTYLTVVDTSTKQWTNKFSNSNGTDIEKKQALKYHELYNFTEQICPYPKRSTLRIDDYLHVSIGANEIPTFTYQVEFVSDEPNIIIGSRLADIGGLISSKPKKSKFLWLTKPLNKLDKRPPEYATFSDSTTDTIFNNGKNFISGAKPDGVPESTPYFVYRSKQLTVPKKDIKGWVIIDIDTQQVLIGKNEELEQGKQFYITFTAMRNFYK